MHAENMSKGMSVRRKTITATQPVAEHNRIPKAQGKAERKKKSNGK